MKIISVNVGRTRVVPWKGRVVVTGIYKKPVSGSVPVRKLNLEGDVQADRSVHGGAEKAVYVYPSEHYAYWKKELPEMDLSWGIFGENLTTEGLMEEAIHIGDRLRIGSAEARVTQPRMPCFKLEIRFERDDMIKRFLKSGRPGFYLAVTKEGEVGAGDSIERIHHDPNQVTVSEMFQRCLPPFRS